MRSEIRILLIAFGAVIGGLLVGPFRLQPPWLWGILGGLAGGLIGAAAAWLSARPWRWPLRAAAILLVAAGGFFLLWLAAGRQYLLDSTVQSIRRALGE